MLRTTDIGGQSALEASSAQLLDPRLVEHHGRQDKVTVRYHGVFYTGQENHTHEIFAI